MCMGPPDAYTKQESDDRVYPHVYGATQAIQFCMKYLGGLSPCVWGHHGKKMSYFMTEGSIPMCMGPPVQLRNCRPEVRVYPHVYGPISGTTAWVMTEAGLSER